MLPIWVSFLFVGFATISGIIFAIRRVYEWKLNKKITRGTSLEVNKSNKIKWILFVVGGLFMVGGVLVSTWLAHFSWVAFCVLMVAGVGFYFFGAFATIYGLEKCGSILKYNKSEK